MDQENFLEQAKENTTLYFKDNNIDENKIQTQNKDLDAKLIDIHKKRNDKSISARIERLVKGVAVSIGLRKKNTNLKKVIEEIKMIKKDDSIKVGKVSIKKPQKDFIGAHRRNTGKTVRKGQLR